MVIGSLRPMEARYLLQVEHAFGDAWFTFDDFIRLMLKRNQKPVTRNTAWTYLWLLTKAGALERSRDAVPVNKSPFFCWRVAKRKLCAQEIMEQNHMELKT